MTVIPAAQKTQVKDRGLVIGTKKIRAAGAVASTKKKKGIKYLLLHPLSLFRRTDLRVDCFLKLIENHLDFFKACPQIDSYLVAMAYEYLQRAQPSINPHNYSTELLFCCLYLAWETEEDSTLGVEGIIHYVVGRYPSSSDGKNIIMRKYEVLDWKKRLRQFHSGKDLLWKALDFNTYVDHHQVAKVLMLFPEEDIYRRQRQDQELARYF